MDQFNKNTYDNYLRRLNNTGILANVAHDEEEETGIVDSIKDYRNTLKESYYRSILNPEYHISKIPSRMPVESAVAPLKYNFSITPNSSGKFALVIDPFYSTAWLYNSASVDGVGGGTATSIAFPQDATIIDQWRLVSSSVVLKYYGSLNSLSGYFVACTTSNVANATQTTYLTFSNVEDQQNKQVLKCVEGVKMIYSPMDEKATDFNSQSTYTAGTHPCRWQYLFVIIGDSFPNTSSIRVDFYRNIEYTSLPAYKEYINHTKEQSCEYKQPNVINNVGAAPRQSNPMVSIKDSIGDKIANAVIDEGKKLFGQYMTGWTSPFMLGQKTKPI